MLILLLIILFVIVPMLLALWLVRKWADEKLHKDVDKEALGQEDIQRFNKRQKFTLALLSLPPVFFLLGVAVYFLSALVVYG